MSRTVLALSVAIAVIGTTEAFPLIRFESDEVHLRSEDALRLRGALTLHGVTRDIEIEAEVEADDPGYGVRGSFEIELRDFGIEPVSIGGVVKVANEVEISFEVFASPPAPAARN